MIYDLNSHDESMRFVSAHYDELVEELLDSSWICISIYLLEVKGIQYNLGLSESDLIKNFDFKVLLQVSQHLLTLKPKSYNQ